MRPDPLISTGSLSAEEGRADKIFGWTDGVIFHFSFAVLVEMAEGFCSEQEMLLAAVASSPSGPAGSWHHHDKSSPESNPRPLWLPHPKFLGTHSPQCISSRDFSSFPFPTTFSNLQKIEGCPLRWDLPREDLLMLVASPSQAGHPLNHPLATRVASCSTPRPFLSLSRVGRKKGLSHDTKYRPVMRQLNQG